MTDLIDPFATPNTDTPPTADMPPPDADAAPAEADPNRPPEAPPAPEEETNEQWMHRFIAENAHLARPRPERPPPPPPSPWDGPISSWKVPDHLSLRHRNGGYMAMALLSRAMDDLDEVTGGTRAATYEEVDKYFGHALIAEGLVPFTYTADEAIRWWKSGGYKVLGNQSIPHGPPAHGPLEKAHLDAPRNLTSDLDEPAALGRGGAMAMPSDNRPAGSASPGLRNGSADPASLPTIWGNASAVESDSPFADTVARLVPDRPARPRPAPRSQLQLPPAQPPRWPQRRPRPNTATAPTRRPNSNACWRSPAKSRLR
jgi:hypothetical protein